MAAKAPPMQIALLRGINVGGHNKVAMVDLRNMCEALGLSCVQSILQSGNLVFQSDRLTDAALERLLESETAKRLRVSAEYIVRSADELARVVARNPFPKEAKNDPSHLLVVFFKAAPRAKDVEALRDSIKGREVIAAAGKQLYVAYPDGIGRSKLTGTLIEKKLATKGTARNWNTLLKLCALCE
jgi:uncharacterized protein (DUF1697 family)